MGGRRRPGARRAICFVCAALSAGGAVAQETAPFFAGKTITIAVGSPPGGGYDIAARAVAHHFGKHVPGRPTVIVQNVPGASSLALTNQLYAAGRRDGTIIGVVINGMVTAPLLAPAEVRFNLADFIWIGNLSRDVQVVTASAAAPAKTIDDLFTTGLMVGGQTPGNSTVDIPLGMNGVLRTKFTVVRGYESSGAVDLAIERGEVHGNGAVGWVSVKSRNQQWLREGKLRVLAQYGWKKHADLPDVPLFPVPDAADDRQALRVLWAGQDFGRPFLLPPGVPADRVAILRDAFEKTVGDPDFRAEAAKLAVDIDPDSGETLQQLARDILATSPAVAARLREMLK